MCLIKVGSLDGASTWPSAIERAGADAPQEMLRLELGSTAVAAAKAAHLHPQAHP